MVILFYIVPYTPYKVRPLMSFKRKCQHNLTVACEHALQLGESREVDQGELSSRAFSRCSLRSPYLERLLAGYFYALCLAMTS